MLSRIARIRRGAAGLVLAAAIALGVSGCVLLPVPVPRLHPPFVGPRRPVVVVPVPPIYPYGYGYHGRGLW
jgi:hypothetical protein